MKYEIIEPCASCEYSDIHILNHYVFDDVCDVPEEGTGTQSLYCSHEQICSKLKEYEEKEKFDVLKKGFNIPKHSGKLPFSISPGPDEKLHDIIFDDRGEAEKLADALNKLMDKYNFVSVADVHELVEKPVCGDEYTIGWSDRVFDITRDVCEKPYHYIYRVDTEITHNRKKQYICGTWISVDDHLPDKDKYDWVLVQTWIDDVFGMPHIAELRDGKWYDTEADGDMESTYMIKVTHWMPLPPFPNGLWRD